MTGCWIGSIDFSASIEIMMWFFSFIFVTVVNNIEWLKCENNLGISAYLWYIILFYVTVFLLLFFFVCLFFRNFASVFMKENGLRFYIFYCLHQILVVGCANFIKLVRNVPSFQFSRSSYVRLMLCYFFLKCSEEFISEAITAWKFLCEKILNWRFKLFIRYRTI